MKADYTGGHVGRFRRRDGDNRQMKADYTPWVIDTAAQPDGDNRQMKADYTYEDGDPLAELMEITAK